MKNIIPQIVLIYMLLGISTHAQLSECVGDGATDDTDALSIAISEANGILLLDDNKIYLVTKTLNLPAGLTLKGGLGDEEKFATIVCYDNSQILKFCGSNSTIENLNIMSGYDVIPTDRTKDNVNLAMITLRSDISDITVKNCKIFGTSMVAGVLIDNPRIRNVTIDDNTFTGMAFGVLTNTTMFEGVSQDWSAHLSNLYIRNNTMSNLWGDGIQINSPVYGGKLPLPEVNEGYPGGDWASANPAIGTNHVYIEGNTVYAPDSRNLAGFGISVAGAKFVEIKNNKIFHSKWQGIHVEDFAYNVLIKSNVIWKIEGPDIEDEISWNSGRAGVLCLSSRGIWILDNDIIDTYDAGIALAWTSNPNEFNKRVVISGNRIKRPGRISFRSENNGIMIGGIGEDALGIQAIVGPVSDLHLQWPDYPEGEDHGPNEVTLGQFSNEKCWVNPLSVGVTMLQTEF